MGTIGAETMNIRREMNMIQKFGIVAMVALLVASVLSLGALAQTVPVDFVEVKVNGDTFRPGEVLGVDRTDTLDVRVKLDAFANGEVEVRAEIEGDDHNEVSDETERFTVKAGNTYVKELTLRLPHNIDPDVYVIRIDVLDRRNERISLDVPIEVTGKRHNVVIDDVTFNPGTSVMAGRSLLARVRLDNLGDKDQDDVKVTLSLDDFGVKDVDFVEELESDDQKSSEELFVRIPECALPGQYPAVVTVEYDESSRTAREEFTITVLENPRCKQAEEKAVITIGPESQNIVAGGPEATFPVAITNAGSESRTYTVSATAGEWGTARVSSSVLVIGSGETKVTSVQVAASKDATPGEKLVTVSVKSADKTLKEVALKANVVAPRDRGLIPALQIGLVVLVVLLVVVGLIVGLSRMKGSETEGKGKEETYY